IHPENLFQNLIVGLSLSTFLLLINLITNGKGMGLGDVKFAIFGGLFWGWPQGLIWLFLSFLVGGIFGSILLLTGKAKLKQKIAFGPFLVIGFLINLFFGNFILNSFLSSIIR
ncbi:prepilin peptidase, partial [Candidatus Woesebacteria bacterium]|nr:prepilin peptidase [Candidatus Woesebacteria bacterium]